MEETVSAGSTKKSGVVPSGTAEAPATSATTANTSIQTATPSGTQRFFGIFSPYRVDVQQGNFVSLEMMSQLKEGMKRPEGITREQVRFVLGTPLLTDIFHVDRWDYIFRLKKGNGELVASNISLFFKDNRLARVDGSILPTEKDYITLIAGAAPAAMVQPVIPASQAR